ncbi:MAG: nucleotide exchange factor GrpE [Sodaliphilus sp.]
MSKQEQEKNQNVNPQEDSKQETPITDTPQEEPEATEPDEVQATVDETPAEEELDELEQVKAQLEKSQKEYLFLMAEFDNYRKRTLKEKADLIKNGGERAMLDLLPVVDDFERAIQAVENSDDVQAVKEGILLIYNKFVKYLESQQVKAMESTGAVFDADIHEAVTTFPAPEEEMKGKVIDTVQKGYTINDKVLRHAKVVVGQ